LQLRQDNLDTELAFTSNLKVELTKIRSELLQERHEIATRSEILKEQEKKSIEENEGLRLLEKHVILFQKFNLGRQKIFQFFGKHKSALQVLERSVDIRPCFQHLVNIKKSLKNIGDIRNLTVHYLQVLICVQVCVRPHTATVNIEFCCTHY
jgi:hypothetical protein